MPFTLKVTKGAGAGAEFPFDTEEARLGRTADNDIVVKDSGASRSHARVFQKGLRYFVEDMQSANGTKVNTAVITGTKELKNGDTITIGEVVFTFSFADVTLMRPQLDAPSPDNDTILKGPADTGEVTGETTGEVTANTAETPAIDPNATMLRPPPAAVSRGAPDFERERRTSGQTRPSFADDKTVPPTRAKFDDSETVPPQRGLARRPAADDELKASDSGTLEVAVPPALVRRGGGKPTDDGDDDELTAADKLRIKRHANKSAMGRLQYQWKQLPKNARKVTIAVGALFMLGIVSAIVWAAWPKKKQTVGPEPAELMAAAPSIQASFGVGEGVTFERPDMKVFSFTAASATRIVGVLHYQAKDIAKDEVALWINGYDLGFVPPDTLDTANREIELVLPAQQIKKGETNTITFDNIRNPPNEDAWRVWNLWLELIAIPDMSPEETINAVKEDLQRSQAFFDQRDIGPDNLFKAWRGYRDAWLKMESMPGRPDELYIVARSQQREIAQMLDKRCNMMLLDFQKAVSAKKPDRTRARQVAEDMLRYFPTREHRCHGMARELLENIGGL